MNARKIAVALYAGIILAAITLTAIPQSAYAQDCGAGILPVPCPPGEKHKRPKPTSTPTRTATPIQNYAFAGIPKPTPTQIPPNKDYSPLNNMPPDLRGMLIIVSLLAIVLLGGFLLVRSRSPKPRPRDAGGNPGPPDLSN